MIRNLTLILTLLCAAIIAPSTAAVSSRKPDAADAADSLMRENLLRNIRSILAQTPSDSRHIYNVTAGVRILFFWYSRDDVGEGYVRSGSVAGNPDDKVIELVMGSDPAKAPRGINRWGAATESYNASTGTGYLFAFMKASKGNSVSQMEGELDREGSDRDHYFESIVSKTAPSGMYSLTVPIHSPTDLTLHQLPVAEEMVLEHMSETDLPSRSLDAGSIAACGNSMGMLFALRKLTEAALAGRKAPLEQCYFYNSKPYILTLDKAKPVVSHRIAFKRKNHDKATEHTYENLISANFHTRNTATGSSSKFKLLIGTEGDLKGVPVQVLYQPNWWFRVVLNLDPEGDAAP